jgi:hypothetical protein
MDAFTLALVLGTPGLAGLAAAQVLRIVQRRQARAWRKVAEAAGMDEIEERRSLLSSEILSGRLAGRALRVQDLHIVQPDDLLRGRFIRITVEGTSELTLRPETPATVMQKAAGAREIELGDEAFDSQVYIHGKEDVLRAVLDAETRRVVRGILQAGLTNAEGPLVEGIVTVRGGEVVAEFDRHERRVRECFPSFLGTLCDVARRLDRPASLVKRIVENTRSEPEWRVRRGNLQLLAQAYPNHPATREALARGCQDERQAVQLECALALGVEQAEGTLREIATSEWADDGDAARATSALGVRLPRDTALAILAHALRTRRQETAHATIAVLGQHGGAEVVGPLAKVLSLGKGPLGAAAAQALGASRSPAAEAPLLQALESGATEICVAAAAALGQAGTASAVLPLKDAAERARDGVLRKAAREAIAAIQSRLGGASPGQLSLADGEAGQLSLTDEDPRGRVSIAAPERSGAPRARR